MELRSLYGGPALSRNQKHHPVIKQSKCRNAGVTSGHSDFKSKTREVSSEAKAAATVSSAQRQSNSSKSTQESVSTSVSSAKTAQNGEIKKSDITAGVNKNESKSLPDSGKPFLCQK